MISNNTNMMNQNIRLSAVKKKGESSKRIKRITRK